MKATRFCCFRLSQGAEMLRIADKVFDSHLFTGTGKFASPQLMVDAIRESGSQLVTRLPGELTGTFHLGQSMFTGSAAPEREPFAGCRSQLNWATRRSLPAIEMMAKARKLVMAGQRSG